MLESLERSFFLDVGEVVVPFEFRNQARSIVAQQE